MPDAATPSEANLFTFRDDVVINEIMYHHRPIMATDTQPYEEVDEEWIELFNRGDTTIDLAGWRLDDCNRYEFPLGTTLAPGDLVVANNSLALATQYPDIAIVGNFSGRLANSGERIAPLDARGNPADEVRYYEGGRWPAYADGAAPASNCATRTPTTRSPKPGRRVTRRASPVANLHLPGIVAASVAGPDHQWRDFILGLLDAGECLFDDMDVIDEPTGRRRDDPERRLRMRLPGGECSGTTPQPGHRRSASRATTCCTWWPPVRRNTCTTISRPRWAGIGPWSTAVITRFPSGRDGWRDEPTQHPALLQPRGADDARRSAAAQRQSGAPELDQRGEHRPDLRGVLTSCGRSGGLVPVTVRMMADDPEDVAGMAVWYSVGGGAWSMAAMGRQAGGEGHRGTIPGQPASTIVQFYVEGVDTLGATSTFPAAGADSRALYKVEDGLAASNGLHNLRIVMTPDDAQFLHTDINLMSNDPVGATVIYNEHEIFYDVGVRLKGSERGRVTVPRLGFAVSFNADQLFRGVHESVLIDRSHSTEFGQREILINQTMTHAGGLPGEYNDLIQVIALWLEHTGSAELQLARYSDVFLDSQYLNGSEGEVFEYELIYYPTTANAQGYKRPQPDGVSARRSATWATTRRPTAGTFSCRATAGRTTNRG